MAFLFRKKRTIPSDVFKEELSTDEEVLSYHEELFRLSKMQGLSSSHLELESIFHGANQL